MRHAKDAILSQGLTLAEYDLICRKIGREPNEVELGIFAVMWSEHCSYKSSRKHLKKFPTQGPRVLQGPGENAGIVSIGEGWAVAFKMESHNHPSYIEPYQGAATGVGGILRDVFTMGARPICNLDSLRFGAVDHPKTPYLVHGVVAGIAGYGNCMGVPTVGGEVYFDPCYNGNILVNAMTVGLVREDKIYRGTASGIGNSVIYVGSKTGRDGIHGATMASDEFTAASEEKRPTVQVGDPFTEKLLMEACLELMEKPEVIVGIQDMGAAGLTSSSFEMASRAGTGLEIELDLIPMREAGMTPYEILLSESQERMLMVVAQGKEDEVFRVFAKWGLDACSVGKVVAGNHVRMFSKGECVVDLPVSPVTDEAPLYDRPAARPAWLDALQATDVRALCRGQEPHGLEKSFLALLSSPNIVSRRAVWEQYDHQVMTNTVVCPGSDAAVLRIKGTPFGIAVTVNCNSRYCYLDPREGAKIAVAESARNLVAAGATPLAITDCLNFGNPEKAEIMWQFQEAVAGIAEACEALGTPVVSGNVSLYNETEGVAIYPTPTIGMIGLLNDVSRHQSQWFKREGDLIYLIGETQAELGGSEYLAHLFGKVAGLPPRLDLARERHLHAVCLALIQAGCLESAHDLSEGGLAVALAEACFHPRGLLGFEIELPQTDLSATEFLFSESQSRMLVSIAPENAQKIKEILHKNKITYYLLGKVQREIMSIHDRNHELLAVPSSIAFDAWKRFPV